jgi:S-adenosylmethionine-diacylglycerol 3-amino-3-carboxypropyl transferase
VNLRQRLTDGLFRWYLRHQLIYQSCWEDPRVDRAALNIKPSDNVLAITSGGCNALAYALDEPQHIYAVDLNERQNALLELKLAGIRRLDFDLFFDFFGRGYSPDARQVYRDRLRPELTSQSRRYWDRRIHQFSNSRRSFYTRGGIGNGIWLFRWYIDHVARLRPTMNRLFESGNVDEQVRIYREQLRDRFWKWPVRKLFNSRFVLASAGIPESQWRHSRQESPDVVAHLDRCAEQVLGAIPLQDNYFWQLYVHGAYTQACCPDYLKAENFARLKGGLAERISIHTATVSDFLRANNVRISKFALLDHFDWSASRPADELAVQWQAILDRAQPDARLLWRSMGSQTDFFHDCCVTFGGESRRVGDLLNYDRQLADSLKGQERANAYPGLFIAELRGS